MKQTSKLLTRTNQFLSPTISKEMAAKERPNATSATQWWPKKSWSSTRL